VKTVRELSGAGPCFTLGVVLRETAWRISYRDRHGTSKFRLIDIKHLRVC
jgi:hypothetical protein